MGQTYPTNKHKSISPLAFCWSTATVDFQLASTYLPRSSYS